MLISTTSGISPSEIVNSALETYFAVIRHISLGHELWVKEPVDVGKPIMTKMTF